MSQGTHGLESFNVFLNLLGGVAVNLIPILGADNVHAADGEVFVEPLAPSFPAILEPPE